MLAGAGLVLAVVLAVAVYRYMTDAPRRHWIRLYSSAPAGIDAP
jgi:hypothetical protein